MAYAKGMTIINAVKALRKNKEVARKLLPEHLQCYLEKRIIVTGWYPEEHVLEIQRVLAKIMPDPGMDKYEWQGHALAVADLNGIYADLIIPGDPATSLRRLSIFWELYHDTGKENIVTISDDHIVTEIEGFAYPSRETCKTIVGWNAQCAIKAGGKNVKSTHEGCVLDGAKSCQYIVRWEL